MPTDSVAPSADAPHSAIARVPWNPWGYYLATAVMCGASILGGYAYGNRPSPPRMTCEPTEVFVWVEHMASARCVAVDLVVAARMMQLREEGWDPETTTTTTRPGEGEA